MTQSITCSISMFKVRTCLKKRKEHLVFIVKTLINVEQTRHPNLTFALLLPPHSGLTEEWSCSLLAAGCFLKLHRQGSEALYKGIRIGHDHLPNGILATTLYYCLLPNFKQLKTERERESRPFSLPIPTVPKRLNVVGEVDKEEEKSRRKY